MIIAYVPPTGIRKQAMHNQFGVNFSVTCTIMLGCYGQVCDMPFPDLQVLNSF